MCELKDMKVVTIVRRYLPMLNNGNANLYGLEATSDPGEVDEYFCEHCELYFETYRGALDHVGIDWRETAAKAVELAQ